MKHLGNIKDLREEFKMMRKAGITPEYYYHIDDEGEVYAQTWDELTSEEKDAINEYINDVIYIIKSRGFRQ